EGRGGPGWLVHADGRRWLVVADVHGVAVVRAGEIGGEVPAPGVPAAALAGVVPWVDTVTGGAVCPGGTDGAVALVSRAHSYCVDVVRLPARVAA
uniref:hypothetical protein n=1 Tax=Actinotalea sp. JY-7885 TaxID=2758576 RepID=UPI001CB6E77E